MKQVQKSDLEILIGRAAPIVFVLLWSTGFIGTKYVLNGTEPLTYLTMRMMLVVAIMAVIVAWVRPAWPDRAGIGHSIIAGLLVQGLYLAGTVFAVAHKVPVGLSALIPGLQPILTSILASRVLGERVTLLQWGGVALGLAGVLLILHGRPMTGEAGWGWFASGVSLITITVGTLYQKRYCGGIDWRTGSFIQQISAMVMLGIGAWALETNVIHWSAEFVLSVVWLAVVLSIGTVGLLYWLLRRQASSQVASLFYLVPAVTALMAFVLFGEKLDAVAIIGMIACGAAVLLVNRAKA
ncbi:DMT family transporter [Tardiphaga sp. 42S5]|uniref:DMT family transporter n=1 Tax=Tardiphaga sp. 42S5 TaxID=1404799 RepID=UPI002A5A4D4F|nr:DMT family transporter [Tardiphaga sp. 42S5]WPO39185.1 DMT family transporter [Tardiphaga sp. 42S5]